MQNVIEFRKSEASKIQWTTIVPVVFFHIFAVVALFNFSWINLAVTVLFWWIANSLGVGLGYHRFLTHRGFKTPKWLEYLLAVCGTLALQSGPINWVTTHRIHHAFTETDKDPHSPIKGFYWAHIGWIFQGTSQVQPESAIQRYAPDLAKDNIMRFISKYYWMSTVILSVILFAVGGWSMVFWAVMLRTVFGWHTTWLVNSATHTWGTRRFDSRDTSTNNGWIAALTFGEGWHNNHHTFPRSARHGLTAKEIDINWIQISILQKLGLAKDVYAFDLAEYEQNEKAAKPLQKAA